MIKIILLIALIWATSGFASAQSYENTIKWQSDTLNIDGFSGDWKNNLRFYNEETKMRYGITNDSSNLYLCFQIADRSIQKKIMHAGMSVDFKLKTKPKRTASIDFPLPDKSSSDIQNKPGQPNESPKMKEKYLLSNKEAQVSGFVSTNGIIDTQNQKNIQLTINWDKGDLMNYELRIPLEELFGKNYKLSDVSSQDIALQATVNALERPKNTAKDDDTGNQRSMSEGYEGNSGYQQMGEMGSGNYPGGHANRMNPQFRSYLFESQILKNKFKLCTEPK